MIMSLEGLTGEQILKVELATGVPIVYKLDDEGKVVSKEVLSELTMGEGVDGGWT
jgi:2,3-bisphosphoglycerate-dependent phosphoglycerate mutase